MCVLLNQQCIHLYGIENCVIQDKLINPILVTWNKAVRSIWNLPNRAHSNSLPILSGRRPLQEKIKLKQLCAEFQVKRGFSQKVPADLLSYNKIHS